MALVIGIVVVAVCLAAVLLPFRRRTATPWAADNPIDELQQSREALYLETGILRQDHELGHFTVEEYQERLQSYRMRAAALLQQQERLEAWNQRLEEEILALRTVPNAPDGAGLCHECGRAVGIAAEHCPHCGSRLHVAGSDSYSEDEP